jgi:hypothetical protein
VAKILSTTRTELREVLPCLREAQLIVGATANPVGIVVVSPVVLPETNRTDLS